jgi:PAS domain S-box-containing protein
MPADTRPPDPSAPGPDDPYRLLVGALEDSAILLLDPDGFISGWDAGAERLTGYRAEEVVGRHLSLLYTPECVARGQPRRGMEAALGKGRFEEEGERVRKGGTRFLASAIITALHDGGRHVGFASVTRDVTERRRAEEALRRGEELFRSAFEDTHVAMVLTDADHRFVRVNAAFARLFGYGPEEMLALSMADVTHPDDLAESHARRGPLQAGEADYTLRGQNRHIFKSLESMSE